MLTLNVRGLRTSVQVFILWLYLEELAAAGVHPDVVCLQETWLKPGDELALPGWETFRCDRRGRGGGGVATLTRPWCQAHLAVDPTNSCVVAALSVVGR